MSVFREGKKRWSVGYIDQQLPTQFVFKRLPKRDAEVIADMLTRFTGDVCRTSGSNRHGYTVERFDGSKWIEG